MNFTDWTFRHPRFLLSLLTVFTIAGATSGLWLPVALFPQVSFPRIRINLDAGDRPAERMTIEVTTPVEDSIRSIPGVRTVRSTTSRGSAEISVNFDWGEDMIPALLQVESQINKVLPTLPTGTTFNVIRMDPTVFPVIAYSITSDTHSLTELRDLAQYSLRPALATVTGVAQVGVQGGNVEEYEVVVSLPKLQSFGLSFNDVADALAAANVLVATGRVEQYGKLYLVISDTRFQTFADIGKTILKSGPDGTILLTDVATVERSSEPQWIRVTADGHDAVLFQVYQQPGGNTVQIAQQIKAKLQSLQKQTPEGVRIASWYDQSDLILGSTNSARDCVLIGVGLASCVLFLFLRNWKITLFATIAVPSVLCATVLLLYVFKMSFNIMTLGGLAAAVGLIIDDTIVMAEHIVRRVRERRSSGPKKAILTAAAEFTRPLAGSSAATIIIFAPLAFLSGVTGAFFQALSLTMAASLVISFLVAWIALPVISTGLFAGRDAHFSDGGKLTQAVHRAYENLMRPLLRTPVLIILALVPFLGAGYFAFYSVQSGFMPVMDEGGFIIDYRAPPGTSLTETDRLMRQVEAILQKIPEVQTYSRRTGLGLGGDLNEANQGDFFVRLKSGPRRGIEEIMDDLRAQVEHNVPGIEIETAQLMEDLIGDLTSVPQPVEIKLFSNDEAVLQKLAPQVAEAISAVPGIVEVKNGIVPAGDALEIHVDRVKAALEGVDADSITKTLSGYLSGTITTKILHAPKLVSIRVWTPESGRATDRDLANLLLPAPDGHLFPLNRVATFSTVSGQPQITREDSRRMIAVTARISGRDLGSTARDVQRVLDKPGLLPANVLYSLGGLYEQQQIAFQGLTVILIAAIVLVLLLLLFLYESYTVALAMLITTLLAVAGVYIGLWATGTEINITSRMGMTMIVGIVTEVAIFYYSEFQEIGDQENRFIIAGVNRMRPIAMTTFAAILALLPLALGIGEGSAMLKPLAIAIISGLVFQLPLVLIVFPCLLALVRRDPKRKRDAQDHQPSAHTESALAFRHNAGNEAEGSK
jgi:CzcA family heavy metal efflux pump